MADRKLTDADVAAIVDALEERMTEKFYNDLGKGVWGMVWKTVVIVLVGIASYGAVKGLK
jgi:hypothetical protein